MEVAKGQLPEDVLSLPGSAPPRRCISQSRPDICGPLSPKLLPWLLISQRWPSPTRLASHSTPRVYGRNDWAGAAWLRGPDRPREGLAILSWPASTLPPLPPPPPRPATVHPLSPSFPLLCMRSHRGGQGGRSNTAWLMAYRSLAHQAQWKCLLSLALGA